MGTAFRNPHTDLKSVWPDLNTKSSFYVADEQLPGPDQRFNDLVAVGGRHALVGAHLVEDLEVP